MKYSTVVGKISVKNVIKRSTFIATVERVDSIKEAETRLKEIKEDYKNATHNPYAYRIIDGSSYYSDDSEPTNSAGLQIFNAIRSCELYNVLAVVTRFFGGVKLGKANLAEAYKETALFALRNAKIIELQTTKQVEVILPYTSLDYLNYILKQISHEIISREFSSVVKFDFVVNEDDIDSLEALVKKDENIEIHIL